MKLFSAIFAILLFSSCASESRSKDQSERPGDPLPSASCNNEVELAWDASTTPGVNYTVHVGPSSGNYLWQFDVTPGHLTHVVGEMGLGNYYFAMSAYNAYGRSGYSNEVKREFTACSTRLEIQGGD